MASALKAGTLDNFAGSLASYMEQAMQKEWQSVKGEPLPGGLGEDDRRILFAAVAQGVLKFLYDHRADLVTGDEISSGSGDHHHEMAFTISVYR